ncbi:hypothetical protein FKM82_022138 [Ascaphus truei]
MIGTLKPSHAALVSSEPHHTIYVCVCVCLCVCQGRCWNCNLMYRTKDTNPQCYIQYDRVSHYKLLGPVGQVRICTCVKHPFCLFITS